MQKINFQNLPSTTTPINATNLNAIQTNAETAINNVAGDLSTLSTSVSNYVDGTTPMGNIKSSSITTTGDATIGGIINAKGSTIPYAYTFMNSRVTLSNISAWSETTVPFSNFGMETSHSDLFEKNGNFIKCKFTGKVMIIREISMDAQGELDIADEFSWFTATSTKQNHSITIKNVSLGDNIGFVFSGGMSGTITLYSARLILLRIG